MADWVESFQDHLDLLEKRLEIWKHGIAREIARDVDSDIIKDLNRQLAKKGDG